MNNREKAAKLREARALIDTPEKWWDGKGENWGTPTYCVVQATAHVMNNLWDRDLDIELGITLNLQHTLPEDLYLEVAMYNDTHTHAEVLDLFDKTIARLEAL